MKVLDSLVEAAVNRRIPIMLLQNVSDVLCATLELKSLSCFCLLKKLNGISTSASISSNNNDSNSNSNDTKNNAALNDMADDIHLSAKLDALNEMILIYAKKA